MHWSACRLGCLRMVQLAAKKTCWWAHGWCFASRGFPAWSTVPGLSSVQGPTSMEVSWDCTAHIMPYLRYLHAWLLKVDAEMPNLAPAPELAAPVEVRIDHVLLQANQDRHELCENPQPHHQRVRKPRFHKGGKPPTTPPKGPKTKVPQGGGRARCPNSGGGKSE